MTLCGVPSAACSVAQSLAGLLGLSTEVAGFILGFIVIFVIVVAMSWLIGIEAMKGFGIAIPAGIGLVITLLLEWWPWWTAIIVGLIIALVIFNPFSKGSG
jgi:hypothetical protein